MVSELDNSLESAVTLESTPKLWLPFHSDRFAGYAGVSFLRGAGADRLLSQSEDFNFTKGAIAIELRCLLAAPEKVGGGRTRAADLLKITYSFFRHYAKKHNVQERLAVLVGA